MLLKFSTPCSFCCCGSSLLPPFIQQDTKDALAFTPLTQFIPPTTTHDLNWAVISFRFFFRFHMFFLFLHIISLLCLPLTFSLHTPSYLIFYCSTHFLSLCSFHYYPLIPPFIFLQIGKTIGNVLPLWDMLLMHASLSNSLSHAFSFLHFLSLLSLPTKPLTAPTHLLPFIPLPSPHFYLFSFSFSIVLQCYLLTPLSSLQHCGLITMLMGCSHDVGCCR